MIIPARAKAGLMLIMKRVMVVQFPIQQDAFLAIRNVCALTSRDVHSKIGVVAVSWRNNHFSEGLTFYVFRRFWNRIGSNTKSDNLLGEKSWTFPYVYSRPFQFNELSLTKSEWPTSYDFGLNHDEPRPFKLRSNVNLPTCNLGTFFGGFSSGVGGFVHVLRDAYKLASEKSQENGGDRYNKSEKSLSSYSSQPVIEPPPPGFIMFVRIISFGAGVGLTVYGIGSWLSLWGWIQGRF